MGEVENKKVKENEKMREEVRSAVDEYISSMIAEKRLGGSTQATEISPQDVMVCGHKEGYKSKFNFNQF